MLCFMIGIPSVRECTYTNLGGIGSYPIIMSVLWFYETDSTHSRLVYASSTTKESVIAV